MIEIILIAVIAGSLVFGVEKTVGGVKKLGHKISHVIKKGAIHKDK